MTSALSCWILIIIKVINVQMLPFLFNLFFSSFVMRLFILVLRGKLRDFLCGFSDIFWIYLWVIELDGTQKVQTLLFHKVTVLISSLHLQFFHLSSDSVKFVIVVRLFLEIFEWVLWSMSGRGPVWANRVLVPLSTYQPDFSMIILLIILT